jgi:hypothetical protein
MAQVDSFIPIRAALDGSEARPVAVGLPVVGARSVSELVLAGLKIILERGHEVGGERPSLEVLNQGLCLEEPRDRIFTVEGSSFNIAVAIARFVWNVAGSSDLAAIAAYEPRAREYSDDGKTLPGSDAGARLLGPTTGVNQLAGMVARIREDTDTRRATAVVWRPEDAVRQSRDIPCALAMTCHVRGGALLTTMTMRSNNALRLLPYNLFEFTLLAELVAVEAGIALGSYWHTAQSLHVFEPEVDLAASYVEAGVDVHDAGPMAPMPSDPQPAEQIAILVELEAQLRHAAATKRWDAIADLIRQADATLHDFWFELFAVLALFLTAREGTAGCLDVDGLSGRMTPAIRNAVLSKVVRRH